MQMEIGTILEGKVTGITKFGAFVDLGEGHTGMVHISEIAPVFVNEIRDHIAQDQVVKVKIINISDDGKIALSIKQAMENKKPQTNFKKKNIKDNWQNTKKNREPQSFEDMLAKFKQVSDERMSDLKRMNDSKRGSATPKRGGNSHQR